MTTAPAYPRLSATKLLSGGSVRRWADAGICLAFVGASLLLFRQFAFSTRLTNGGPDARLFSWYLSWSPWAVAHGHWPFFSNYANYPSGVNLAWNTLALPLGLVMWPVTALRGPLAAYNLLIALCPGTAALSAYLVFVRLRARRWAAVVGAFVFGFGPYEIAHSYGHPNLDFLAIFPPILLVARRIFADQPAGGPGSPGPSGWLTGYRRYGVWLGVLLALQFYVSEEMLVDALLVAVAALAVLAVVHRDVVRERIGYARRALGIALGIGIVVCGPVAAYQLAGPQHVSAAVQPGSQQAADLAGFVVPGATVQLHTAGSVALARKFALQVPEQDFYLGVPLVVLLLVLTFAPRFGARNWYARIGVLAALMSLGGHLLVAGHDYGRFSPWLVVRHVPLLENVLPGRMTAFTLLFGGLALALVLSDSRWYAGTAARISVAAIAALVVVPLIPQLPASAGPVVDPQLFQVDPQRWLPPDPVAVIAPYPHGLQADGMLYQAQTGFAFRQVGIYSIVPPVGGRGGFEPQTRIGQALVAAQYDAATASCPSPDVDLAALRGELDRLGVNVLIVAPMACDQQEAQLLASITGVPGAKVGGVWLWTRTQARGWQPGQLR